jgi:hypothetical protein
MRINKMDFWGFAKTLNASRITKWAVDSEEMPSHVDDRVPATLHDDANALTSIRSDTNNAFAVFGDAEHAVVLDLDIPAWLIPSSTLGHSHLYIDTRCSEKDYFALLDALVKCRVIEYGYAEASKVKGATYARLPWVRKGDLP